MSTGVALTWNDVTSENMDIAAEVRRYETAIADTQDKIKLLEADIDNFSYVRTMASGARDCAQQAALLASWPLLLTLAFDSIADTQEKIALLESDIHKLSYAAPMAVAGPMASAALKFAQALIAPAPLQSPVALNRKVAQLGALYISNIVRAMHAGWTFSLPQLHKQALEAQRAELKLFLVDLETSHHVINDRAERVKKLILMGD
jgi:hypothetical protein